MKQAPYYEISMCFYEMVKVDYPTHYFFLTNPLKNKNITPGSLQEPGPGPPGALGLPLVGAMIITKDWISVQSDRNS